MIIPKSFHDLLDLNIVFHNERNSNINFLLPRIIVKFVSVKLRDNLPVFETCFKLQIF